MPIVGMDYFYITKEGVRRREQLAQELLQTSSGDLERRSAEATGEAISKARDDGESVKCLLVRCLQSKNVFAHAVPRKGDDEEHYCAKLAVADIEWLGHTRIIVKTDNERAIVALKHRVAKTLKEWKAMENVQTESPAAYESQSNGGIEVGIKIVRGMFRTLKLCLEARPGKYIHKPRSDTVAPKAHMHNPQRKEQRLRRPDMLGARQRKIVQSGAVRIR